VDSDRARELLNQERERVLRELGDLRRAALGGDGELSSLDQHPADVGTELFDDERDHSMIERLEAELQAIERAEARIEDGTYGLSVDSGEPIPDARLEAVPHAERTVDEQTVFEARRRNAS
jgi:DnaK suppressor protein